MHWKQESWNTHMKPRPNTIVSANFLRAAICRRQTMGIGKMMMTTSMLRLMIQVARKMFVLDPQIPGRRRFQFLAKGRHLRKARRMFPIPKDTVKAIITYVAQRKGLFNPKRES